METSYDYIVCGGGTAGCIVAHRLTEESKHTVLLLEAGPYDFEEPRIKIPSEAPNLRQTRIDWNYKTEPQKHAYQGYEDNIATLARGKVLGGTSSINYMGYARGHSEDYDNWEKAGAEGWGWMDVFPYFLKSENNIIPKYQTEMDHYMGGPMTISLPAFRTPLADSFLEAGIEMGHEVIDINNGLNIGFGEFPATITEEGERCNTSTGFIESAGDRENLTVLTDALVTKIDIEGKSAVGVRFMFNGTEQIVGANKEVIVCCGAIGSPKVLMLSGIGPRQHLEEHGIECIVDLPVGQNLQDHLGIQIKAITIPGSGVITHEALQKNENDMQTTCYLESTAFIQTPLKQPDTDWPEVQVKLMPTFYPYGVDEPDRHVLNSEKFSPVMGYDASEEERMRKEGVTFIPTILHPKSIGEVRLRNKDPNTPPVVNPRYLENQDDIKVLAEGMRFVQKLTETSTMQQYGMQLMDVGMPENNAQDPWSDDNLEQYIRHFAVSQGHPVGTCKLGATSDKTAVVDPHLRVRGIGGLRVIDSSVIPTVPSGGTYAPSMMIAEKTTDMIKEDESVLETVPSVVVEETKENSDSLQPPNLLHVPAPLWDKMSSSPDLLHTRPRSKSTPPPVTTLSFPSISE